MLSHVLRFRLFHLQLDHGQDLEWLSEMRQVSVMFINMKLPDGVEDAARALQKAFEVIYDATIKMQGSVEFPFIVSATNFFKSICDASIFANEESRKGTEICMHS